jgi:hypothetical protein
MSNVNVGTPNPAYVTHPAIANLRRISIDGLNPSEYGMVLAMVEFKNGQVGMVADGAADTFQGLIHAHDLLTKIVAEMDRRVLLHAQTVEGER